MRKILLLAMLVVPVLANATVTKVTVYPNGAVLTDEREVVLGVGENEIVWGELNTSTDIDSVRVELPKGVRLVDKIASVEQSADELNVRRSALEDELKEARKQNNKLSDQENVLHAQQKYLDDIQRASTARNEGESPLPSVEEWEGLLNFTTEKRAELMASLRVLNQKQEDLRNEINRIQREISQLNVGKSLYKVTLTLKLESLRAIARAPVTVSYFDTNASWTPSYHVNVDSQSGDITLGYGAILNQKTQSDWKDVALTLSSAMPTRNATLPKLAPWWLTERPSLVYDRAARPRMQKMALMASAAPMPELMMEEADGMGGNDAVFERVAVASKMTFLEMTLPNKTSLASDNKPVRVVLEELPLEGELSYAVVPELSANAFLQADVTNSSELVLLGGQASLFVDGNFVGKTRLPDVQPAESFDLSLGVDPSVKVERKLLAKKTDLTGFGEDKRKVTYEYETTIENLKTAALAVEVRERLPLSQHEKIKVSVIEPKKAELDNEGVLTWDLALKPNQKETLGLIYSVEYPKDMEVSGL